MTEPGAPRRGRHASPEEGWGAGSPSWGAESPSWYDETPEWDATPWILDDEAPAAAVVPDPEPSTAERYHSGRGRFPETAEWAPGSLRRASGLLERRPDETETGPGPQWRHRTGLGDTGDADGSGSASVPGRDGAPSTHRGYGASGGDPSDGSRHPSGPLPPMPRSAWSKLPPRPDGEAGDETAAADPVRPAGSHRDDDDTDAHRLPGDDWDRTGGLEVIGAHVEEESSRRGPLRRGARQHDEHVDEVHGDDRHGDDRHDDHYDGERYDGERYDGERYDAEHYEDAEYYDDEHDDDDLHDGRGHRYHPADDDTVGHEALLGDEDIPIAPYDPRPQRRRKRRKRVGLLVALVVIAGLVGGVVVGGQKLWGMFASQDYTGSGTGSVQIRIHEGDTLTDIGTTMVSDGVIASVRPFVTAAEANPQSTGIAPGLYGLRRHMSGKAALNLLLQPSSRLVSRVTLPEGLTAKQILQRLAEGTGVPIAQLQAAAADTAGLGLPAYANGSLEGFLFPATYDFEPGTTAQKMLASMVTRTVQVLDQLQIPAEQRLGVLTEASIVQAESGSADDMPKVARVVDNRLALGRPLQLDTTVNYANGKTGLTTTPQDRANPSPYNTYVHTGLPPGPISNPGEEAIKAVLAPAQGDWLYFVVVNPDTGETRFAVTDQEHEANVQLFQQWLRAHPGG